MSTLFATHTVSLVQTARNSVNQSIQFACYVGYFALHQGLADDQQPDQTQHDTTRQGG